MSHWILTQGLTASLVYDSEGKAISLRFNVRNIIRLVSKHIMSATPVQAMFIMKSQSTISLLKLNSGEIFSLSYHKLTYQILLIFYQLVIDPSISLPTVFQLISKSSAESFRWTSSRDCFNSGKHCISFDEAWGIFRQIKQRNTTKSHSLLIIICAEELHGVVPLCNRSILENRYHKISICCFIIWPAFKLKAKQQILEKMRNPG